MQSMSRVSWRIWGASGLSAPNVCNSQGGRQRRGYRVELRVVEYLPQHRLCNCGGISFREKGSLLLPGGVREPASKKGEGGEGVEY